MAAQGSGAMLSLPFTEIENAQGLDSPREGQTVIQRELSADGRGFSAGKAGSSRKVCQCKEYPLRWFVRLAKSTRSGPNLESKPSREV